MILRLPSLFEPYWYGDEGIYQTIGTSLREGRMLYTEIWDNKPPLLYLIYALFWGNQYYVRVANLFWGIFSITIFYYLAKQLFISKKALVWSVLSFALLLGLPILEGNIANAENFMLLPTIWGVFLVFYNKKTSKFLPVFISGFLFAAAFLFKTVAAFDFAVVILFLLFAKRWRSLFPLFVGFVVPVLVTVLFFWIKGVYVPFVEAIFTGNVGIITYKDYFIFPHGLLILKLSSLFGTLGILFFKRKVIARAQQLIYLWFVFSLFSVFFSGRQYLHYLLLLLPAFCLIIGLVFENKKIRKLLLNFILVIIFLLGLTFPIYVNIVGYYVNFIGYHAGLATAVEYRAFFDPITVTNYKVVEYIRQNSTPSETIFVWGNSPQVYKLTNKLPPGRFTVSYHVASSGNNLKETEVALQKSQPKLIIILPDEAYKYPYSLENYIEDMVIGSAIIYRLQPI